MAELLTPDLCIIGAGPGGLAVAEAARRYDASVVLVERDRMGGDSVNAGSIPSKAFIAAARHAHGLRNAAAFGIEPMEVKADYAGVQAHVQQAIDAIAREDSVERFEALGVRIVAGTAKFIDPRTIRVEDTTIRARRFVLATGSQPRLPDIPGLTGVPYLTSDTVFALKERPSHLVIIGGGPLGIELAQAHRRLGAAVTVIEAKTPLAGSDPELVEIALRRMQEEGVVIRSATNVVSLAQNVAGQGVDITLSQGEAQEVISASHLLIATGRSPSVEALQLEKGHIKRNPLDKSALALRSGLRTSNRRVYAVGDAAGGTRFSDATAQEADALVLNALFGVPLNYDRHRIPQVTYCDPEIAQVGLTEPEAKERLRDRYKVVRISFAENRRARAERQSFGLAKLVTDPGGRILGAGIVGSRADELVSLFSLAIANRLSTQHLRAFVPAHPTFSEIARRLGTESARGPALKPWLDRVMALNRLLP
jgi:pyruvate/2-oxoglutarate dehydrogenase complex dihydrolipoamide dehydrogenase (E3) component